MRKAVFLLLMAWSLASFAGLRIENVSDRSLIYSQSLIYGQRAKMAELNDHLKKATREPAFSDIVFSQCGIENAFFDRRTKNIIVCYEWLRAQKKHFSKWSPEGAEAAQMLNVLFVIFHEFGHAVIANANEPILGKEEDAADAIAATIAKKTGLAEAMVMSLSSSVMKKKAFYVSTNRDMSDAHSLTPQRLANVICWMGGNSESVMVQGIRGGHISADRANGCAFEAQETERAVDRIIRR